MFKSKEIFNFCDDLGVDLNTQRFQKRSVIKIARPTVSTMCSRGARERHTPCTVYWHAFFTATYVQDEWITVYYRVFINKPMFHVK